MSEWSKRTLSDLVELQRGHDLPTQDRKPGPIPIIGSFGITGTHNEAKYTGPGVAIGRSGASIGQATFVDEPYWPLNTCLFVKNFNGNNPRWIYRLLDGIDFAAFNSGSAQPSLNRNFLRNIPVAVPPLDEQRAIAEVLGALDDKIAANARVTASTAELATSHYSDAYQYADRIFSLSDLVSTQYGITTSAHGEPGPKFLRVTDINKKPWIEWDGTPNCTVSDLELSKYRVSAGDILVARMADPGKAAFIDLGDPEAVFASYLVRLKAHDPTQALYLYYFLRSPQYLEYAQGAMSGSVQKNMNAKVIVATDVGLPDPSRILHFNETVAPLRRLIQSYLDENRKLAATRDVLLPQLMSGKLRVKDVEKVLENAGV